MNSGKAPERLYQEREQRISDSIRLIVPDRVPVLLGLGYFPAKYTGISCETAYYDPAQWQWATQKTILDFEPDFYRPLLGAGAGPALEALDTKQVKWPGHGIPPDHSHQFVEMEYRQEVEEYCRRLVDVVGKGGGFIMTHRSAIDEARPENIKAMVEFTKRYGVYA